MTAAVRSRLVGLARADARQQRSQAVRELQEFVRFPSVSAQPARAGDVRVAAEWLANKLRRIGLDDVRVHATPRHPIVSAHWLRSPGGPTVLVYGHYDVQPADPLSQWRSPPFEAVIRDGRLFGRGASDDKGQMFAHVRALESYLRTSRRLPVNVRCLFEGEEEIGSPNLLNYLRQHRADLASDLAVISDTRILGPERPAITTSLRGGLGLELEMHGPRRDLHSGSYGGMVHNPLQALCELLARLHDAHGRVAIPGFYDGVRELSDDERRSMASSGPTDATLIRDADITRSWGESPYSLYERTTIRPALTINGLTGGYQGPGGKAVIPSRAIAKVSFRLVPDQNPANIERLTRSHLRRLTPPTIQLAVRTLLRTQPAAVDRRHPALAAAARAYRRVYGAAPVWLRSGGSIPVVNMFRDVLGIPTVLMGFALPDDRIHAPNERFPLVSFDRAIATCIEFLAELRRVPQFRQASLSRPRPSARQARHDH